MYSSLTHSPTPHLQAVLENALLHVQDITERELVRIVQYILHHSSAALDKYFAEVACAAVSDAQKVC